VIVPEHVDNLTPEQHKELAAGRLYAGAVLKKAQAEAYERGRADGRAECVAELRAAAQERRDLAHWSSFVESEKKEFLSDARALQIAADDLERKP
jgi:hypothetical protein